MSIRYLNAQSKVTHAEAEVLALENKLSRESDWEKISDLCERIKSARKVLESTIALRDLMAENDRKWGTNR